MNLKEIYNDGEVRRMSLLNKKDKSAVEEPKREKKKGRVLKKVLIGVGAFFGVIIVLSAIVVMLNWNNVEALYKALTTDTEAIEMEIKESDKEFAKEVKDYLKDNLREYSEEEKQEIANGEKTEMQVIAQIISESFKAPDDNAQEQKPEQKPNESGKNEAPVKQETAEEIVARHVANLYAYQSSFEGRVSALAGSVKAYVKSYKATHPNASWTEAKTAAVSKYMSQGSQIESDCYAKVDAEIAALESDLRKIGADLSIVSTVAASAEKTMQLKKSRIMSQYMEAMK